MARVHRLSRNYWWQKLNYSRTRHIPCHEIGETQEQEFPWRTGACHVWRVPRSKHAIAIGHWTGQQETIFDEADGTELLTMRPLDDWETYVQQED